MKTKGHLLRLSLGAGLCLVFSQEARAMKPSEFFSELRYDNMKIVEEFYASDAHFIDPLGEVRGAENIRKYYEYQYKNAESISWTLEPEIVSGKTQILVWKMHLKAKNLNGGELFTVDGMSRFTIEADGKASFHQDYFDVGAFVYERLPVLKNIIDFIKNRMRQGLGH